MSFEMHILFTLFLLKSSPKFLEVFSNPPQSFGLEKGSLQKGEDKNGTQDSHVTADNLRRVRGEPNTGCSPFIGSVSPPRLFHARMYKEPVYTTAGCKGKQCYCYVYFWLIEKIIPFHHE